VARVAPAYSGSDRLTAKSVIWQSFVDYSVDNSGSASILPKVGEKTIFFSGNLAGICRFAPHYSEIAANGSKILVLSADGNFSPLLL
jgi:hypothetical protein